MSVTEIERHEETIDGLEKDKAELVEELTRVDRERKAAQKQLDTVLRQIDDLERESELRGINAETWRQKFTEEKKAAEHHRSAAAVLEAELKVRDASLERLSRENTGMREDLTVAHDRMADLEDQLRDLGRQKAQADDDLRVLLTTEERNALLVAEIEHLHRRVEDLQNGLMRSRSNSSSASGSSRGTPKILSDELLESYMVSPLPDAPEGLGIREDVPMPDAPGLTGAPAQVEQAVPTPTQEQHVSGAHALPGDSDYSKAIEAALSEQKELIHALLSPDIAAASLASDEASSGLRQRTTRPRRTAMQASKDSSKGLSAAADTLTEGFGGDYCTIQDTLRLVSRLVRHVPAAKYLLYLCPKPVLDEYDADEPSFRAVFVLSLLVICMSSSFAYFFGFMSGYWSYVGSTAWAWRNANALALRAGTMGPACSRVPWWTDSPLPYVGELMFMLETWVQGLVENVS
ncbi:uncharacterized protein V1510DRAFT_361727 [Dipodascopsis tothii]|uniref:uncharacterized protein n=1 Tax=Dipodascopsis tothii TaxID=44089 RepID=UPI0034D00D30